MALASGQFGSVKIGGSNVVDCTGWDFERSVAEHVYAACSTGGYKKRIAGTKDGSGTIRGFLDTTDTLDNYISEGDSVTLQLYYTASNYHEVPALITSISESVDIVEGEIVSWEANFVINGTYTLYN